MKKILFFALFAALFVGELAAQTQYKVITTVESIIPGGLGRSRLIETTTELNADEFTTSRTSGKDSDQGSVKRSDAKIDAFNETKLLNFYSLTGINFQNIASNDALITDVLNKMSADGWSLMHVVSGVESDAGKQDGEGIFITRYIFKK
ncbi:MAG: hypothetical protein H6581_07475 [Bacteroidia bacterium]|nr:hypothetical protein [Bacteroidia bacterium]